MGWQPSPGLNGGSVSAAGRSIAFSGMAALLKQGYSATLGITGDSTGVGSTRWPRLFATWLASQYPLATVQVRDFDSGTVAWDNVPTVIQSGAAGTRYLTFDGTTSTSAASAATTYNNLTGTVDIRVRIKPATNWTTAGCLVSRYPDGTHRCFRFEITSAGKLFFAWSANGSAEVASHQSSVAVGFTAGQGGCVRVVFNPNNGGNATSDFYTAPDGPLAGATWTALGTEQSTVGASSIFSTTTAAWEIGARNNGTSTMFAGGIAEVECRSGSGGPIVNPVLPEQWQATNSNFNGVLSGAPIIDVWNGSWSGASLSGQFIPNDAQMVPVLAAAAWVVNTGKNDVLQDPAWQTTYDSLVTYIEGTNPGAGIAVTAQNPSISPVAQSTIDQLAMRLAKLEAYAARRAFTLIPVYTAFANSGNLASLTNADGIHPSDASGSPLWAQTVETLYTAAMGAV